MRVLLRVKGDLYNTVVEAVVVTYDDTDNTLKVYTDDTFDYENFSISPIEYEQITNKLFNEGKTNLVCFGDFHIIEI